MDSATSPIPSRDVGLQWSEVIRALTNLSLAWVTIGDYIVVMNSEQ